MDVDDEILESFDEQWNMTNSKSCSVYRCREKWRARNNNHRFEGFNGRAGIRYSRVAPGVDGYFRMRERKQQ